ncbi:MAG: SLBB domain-containing protein [Candidatus Kapabacteria bacterium]|jgi:protein involved in polysaccharide export with SLBB domain|nr:SLBB domain-containing protein [Candidatus Kapabacteria bacterium]
MQVLSFRLAALWVIVIGCISSGLYAQSRIGASTGGDVEKLLQPDASLLGASASQAGSGFAADNVVSAEHYFLGPGDVLALEIVGPVSLTVPLVVSPENVVLVPRLGELSVTGKTLAEVKSEIQRLVQSRNANNRAYLTLQRPRTVFVRISGNVVAPGMYSLPASMRVSSAVAIANQETMPLSKERLPVNRSLTTMSDNAPSGQYAIPYSQRNINVLHRNGKTDISDALRSRLTNDAAADGVLREGDEIYVPFEHEATRNGALLSIAGAVQRPCLLPFRRGDRVSLLIKAAFGLSDNADSAQIELLESVSAGASGNAAKTMTMARIMSGQDDIELTAGASIVVREKVENIKRFGTVSVLGEVAQPGVYAIEADRTRLSAIVKQAGGITKNAHLPLSSVTRREIKSLVFRTDAADLSRNFQYTTLTPEDTLRYKLDETMRRPIVACDVAAALQGNSEADNVVLQDGDIITIAANPRNIFVFGQVNKPGFVEAAEGKTVEWYLNAAGNYAPGADTARVRVIKAKNRLWLEPRITTGAAKGTSIALEAGDQIYVPRVPDANSDLALKRVSAEIQEKSLQVQKEALEAQKSMQIWQIILSGIGSATGLYVIFRDLLRTP